jgi:hypothetical protein
VYAERDINKTSIKQPANMSDSSAGSAEHPFESLARVARERLQELARSRAIEAPEAAPEASDVSDVSDVSSYSDIDFEFSVLDQRHDDVAARNAAPQEARSRRSAAPSEWEEVPVIPRPAPPAAAGGAAGGAGAAAAAPLDMILTATRERARNYDSELFTVMFRAQQHQRTSNPGWRVQWMSRSANQTYSNGYWDNIETVSFYPLRDTPQYVMSLWQRYGTGQRLQPIDHPLLHFRDINSNHFYSVANLHPPGFNSRVRRALRFSQTEVHTAIDLSADRLNWEVLRYDAGFLALSRRRQLGIQPVLPAAAEPEQQAAGAAADNYDISTLLAAATLDDAQHLRAWICGICKEGIDAGS